MWRNVSIYVPAHEDWLWHVILLAVVHGAFLGLALLIWRLPIHSLYGVALASVLLLFIGIHNVWDIAVWISIKKQPESR
jgi:hypothetical protein